MPKPGVTTAYVEQMPGRVICQFSQDELDAFIDCIDFTREFGKLDPPEDKAFYDELRARTASYSRKAAKKQAS